MTSWTRSRHSASVRVVYSLYCSKHARTSFGFGAPSTSTNVGAAGSAEDARSATQCTGQPVTEGVSVVPAGAGARVVGTMRVFGSLSPSFSSLDHRPTFARVVPGAAGPHRYRR